LPTPFREKRVHDLLIYVRTVHFASTILVVGVVFFTVAVFNPAARIAGDGKGAVAAVTAWNRLLAWSALVLAVISGAGWMFLTAAAMSGDNLVDVLPSGVLWTVLTETTFGHAWLIRAVLSGALAAMFVPFFSMRGRSSVWLDGAAIAAAAAFVSGLAWAGHAAGGLGTEAIVHPAADVLHLIAASAWVGALAPLAILLASANTPDGLEVVRIATIRFSALGMAAVATLLITGIVNSWYLVGSTEALLGTYYGKLLLLKLGLFLAMVGMATFNWSRLTPALVQTESLAAAQIARRRLCRSATLEVIAGAIIIAIVAVLGTEPPASHAGHHSTSGVVPPDAAFQHIHSEAGMADVMIEPGRIGTARATIRLWNDDLETLPARSLTLTLTAPETGSKPQTRNAVQQPDAAWVVDGIELPQAGNWNVEVDAMVGTGKPLKLVAPIVIDAK
jgi:putative copper resistance protein D